IVAALLVRSLNQASGDPGFAYRQVVSIDPMLGSHGYSPAKARAYVEALESRLREVPGVEAVSSASVPPFGRKTVSIGLEIDGRSLPVSPNSVTPEYFQTMQIPLLRGRNLRRGDARTVVVSQSLAAVLWPGQDA